MTVRLHASRADVGGNLPVFERLAPAPTPALLAARIEAHTGPGDVVADLAGRGGWVARAAVDRQRRAVSIESSPLTRMLAEVVLRPPDVRHLDAAFQGMSASPRGESSLKVSMGDLFTTRCATCGRVLVADEFTWSNEGDGPARPITRHYRCTVCRDMRGGTEARHGELEPEDLARALNDNEAATARAWARDRFPVVDGAPDLVDELLDLHTPRQLVALTAIMDRIEADLRAAPVLAALRLALLHALLPSSRLATGAGRGGALRVAGGHVRLPAASQWRERNPWLAFEEGFRTVRGFVAHLEGGALGPLQARLGEDLQALAEGSATAVLAVASPSALRALSEGDGSGRPGASTPSVRLVLGQPPMRPSLDRLAVAYHGTAWTLGREAAALLPIDALADPSLRAPWSWQAVTIGRSLAAVEGSMARDGRVVQLVDGGAEALAAVAIGAASAGYRVVVARQSDPDDVGAGVIEMLPPGAAVPPGPRTRANVALPYPSSGSSDADVAPGRGLFAPPERFDQRPFSATDAARVVTDAAVETLRARGEPARTERLFGEVLVGLDRSGHLRRLSTGTRPSEQRPAPDPAARSDEGPLPTPPAAPGVESEGSPSGPATTNRPAAGLADGEGGPRVATRRATAVADPAPDPVERLLALIRDELSRPDQRRLTEIEPGRWWLAQPADRDAAAPPLADRVEWAVFSLLSTAGPLSEAAFYERIATLFTGHDLPDETLVRACLESYRSLASTPDHLVTSDDLLRRSHEHTEMLAAITEAGHRLGLRVWLAEREQARRLGRGHLGDLLDDRERGAYLGSIGRAVDALAEVDAIWYIRGKVAMLFEVEWTAMLGEPLLRRHARIGADERFVRFLVVAPERTDLIRHKLDRSPLLRAAMEEHGWNLIKWDHLRTFLSADRPDLDELEPLLGLDPVVERGGEQMPLFGG
ncbi:MAG TPA: hypothetical protein VHK05_01905 [Candidatus Limnocylindrales bacterium]|jgi:hypothetical protein|nr:hypothetical protein [Candidatus Limnocylindrales bacterium]